MKKINLNGAECVGSSTSSRVFLFENCAVKLPRYYFFGKNFSREFEIQNMNSLSLTQQNFHDAGSQSEVYRVGNFAIKCPYDKTVYEILTAVLPDRIVKAIKMEFIEGKRASRVHDSCLFDAKKQFMEEISKAESLGFSPWDVAMANAIYSTENKLYLIDFEHWGK